MKLFARFSTTVQVCDATEVYFSTAVEFIKKLYST